MTISKNLPENNNEKLREEILSAKKALFVGAHPDDIEWYCGGLIQLLRERGTEVAFAIATRGGKGHKGWVKRILEGLRSGHQMNAAGILGGAKIVFYDYPDKGLPQHIEAFADNIRDLIQNEKPDVVLSWDPDHIYNPHPDHQAAAESVREAFTLLPTPDPRPLLCYYGTREPNLWIGYGDDLFRVKLKSLRAHVTEVWMYSLLRGKRYLTVRSLGEGKKIGLKYAETFRCENL